MNSGIYLIKNMVNGKAYIGSTKNLNDRKYQHFSDLRLDKHHNPHLQYSFNKYGEKSFEYYIIAYCPEDKLLEREDFYINYLQSMNRNKGYNLSTAERHIITDEQKKKISESLKELYKIHPKNPLNKEQRNKISESLKNRYIIFPMPPMSDAQKIKISESLKRSPNSNKGKLMSDAQKTKISISVSNYKKELRYQKNRIKF